MKELQASLSKDDYEKIQELNDTIYAAEGIQALEQFKVGVAIGVLLMKELNELPNFRT